MGIPAPNSGGTAIAKGDQANFVLAGQFTVAGGAAVSPACALWGAFNVVIYGPTAPNGTWAGSVQLERSFDGGTTWICCNIGGGGNPAIYANDTPSTDISFVAAEPEKGVLYRLNCTAVTVGPINYRISASGAAAMTWGVPVGAIG